VATDSLISDVSDTARWVAVYRAMETERPDALFRDPFARRLAGEKGEAIVNAMKDGRKMAWPMILRTYLMDEIIMREIANGTDTVLNLAAGLDARAYRMALPDALHWIDVDHPHMVQYKAEAMKHERPLCRYETVPLDLADVEARRALFARVNAEARRVLVITEGLLIYLTAQDVSSLAGDLHAQPTFQRWLSDLASPGLLKMMGRSWGATVAAGNAPFQFGPAEGPKFFAPLGFRELEWRSFFDEGIRLNRTFPMARFFRLLGSFSSAKKKEAFRYFSGVMLLGQT
jgi:methyltransferase (TIGR00027 family)